MDWGKRAGQTGGDVRPLHSAGVTRVTLSWPVKGATQVGPLPGAHPLLTRLHGWRRPCGLIELSPRVSFRPYATAEQATRHRCLTLSSIALPAVRRLGIKTRIHSVQPVRPVHRCSSGGVRSLASSSILPVRGSSVAGQ
jgi:hypothetical protein